MSSAIARPIAAPNDGAYGRASSRRWPRTPTTKRHFAKGVLRSRPETASIPTIALPVHATEIDRRRSLEVGGNDHDTKLLARLLVTIDALLTAES